MVIKICDFGLARNLHSKRDYEISSDVSLPIHHMAVESMVAKKYTLKSDVWSFGVTCWEIFSFGKEPYQEFKQICLNTAIVDGHRLRKPRDCPGNVFKIMERCWEGNPKERPTASELVTSFGEFSNQPIQSTKSGYVQPE